MFNFVMFLLAIILIIFIVRLIGKPTKLFYKIIIITVSLAVIGCAGIIASLKYNEYKNEQDKEVRFKREQKTLEDAIIHEKPEYFSFVNLNKTEIISVYFISDSIGHLIIKDAERTLYLFKPNAIGNSYTPENSNYSSNSIFDYMQLYPQKSNVPWMETFSIGDKVYKLIEPPFSIDEMKSSKEYISATESRQESMSHNYLLCYAPTEVGYVNRACIYR